MQGVACEQVVAPCLNVTGTPWIVTGLSTSMLQRFAGVHAQGFATEQTVPPCVPLRPSGRCCT